MATETIATLVPDPEIFLALAEEEVARLLLTVASQHRQSGGKFHPNNNEFASGYRSHEHQVAIAMSEGWNWLQVHGLIVPAPGSNGQNGWMIFTRRGESIASKEDFERFREAAGFPKSLLHPSIADAVWIALSRGDLSLAVFIAFRTVEEAVREAGGFAETDIGQPLMRRAFNKKSGPLTDLSQTESEREALSHLFTGAIGSYKNPHSHRTVTITDSREAQEMVMLATHLLRIVDARRPK